MEAEDPLSQLRDIHLPEPVTFWPPAPGWWVLLCLLLVGLVFAYRHALAAWVVSRKLASTLAELDQAWEVFNAQAQDQTQCNEAGLALLATINTLLNRVALIHYPDTYAGKLTGSAWLDFLDGCDNSTDFRQGPGTVLADGVYRREFDADADALYQLARQWIQNRYREQGKQIRFFPGRASLFTKQKRGTV